jgi:hypothetical protein
MSLLPAVLHKAGCNATPISISSTLASLEIFLPGLSSGNFCLEEILAIQRAHGHGGDAGRGGEPGVASATRPPEAKASSWRYQGGGQRPGDETAVIPSTNNSSAPGLSLPTRESVARDPALSEREIWRSFEKFDVTGDHKLTFLSIKSAIELYNGDTWKTVSLVDDSQIRDWIRHHDLERKGYVDFENYKKIFSGGAAGYSGSSREQALPQSAETAKREELLRK